jgi:hypothetical protein
MTQADGTGDDETGDEMGDQADDGAARSRPVIPYETPMTSRRAPRGALVDAMSFSTATEAAMAQSRLEVEGIPAFLDNENVVQFNWMLSNATGGVRVMVHESDLDLAREILSAPPDVDKIDYRPGGATRDDELDDRVDSPHGGDDEDDDDDTGYVDEPWRCPQCHRKQVDLVPVPIWALLLALPLMGVPLLFIHRRKRCRACGHQWKGPVA